MNSTTGQMFLSYPTASQQAAADAAAIQKRENTATPLQDVEDFSTVCRTCATVTEFVMPIFEGEGLQNNLAEKIQKHLPIKVSSSDVLPRVVCYQCASTLLAWHELVQCCEQADAALRTRLAVPRRAHKPESESARAETNQEPDHFRGSESFHAQFKSILIDCFPTISEKIKNVDLELVCEKCESRTVASRIEQLAEHVELAHPDVNHAPAIEKFVKNYITLVESLSTDDSDRDVESEPPAKQTESNQLPSYCCPFCKCIFSSTTRLMTHLNQHDVHISIEEGVICCDETFNSQKSFVSHLQTQHVQWEPDEIVNNCRTCGYEANSLQDLENHILETHKDKDNAAKKRKEPSEKNQKFIPAVCPECNKVFSNKYNMFVHMKSHNKVAQKFACDKCDKTYSHQGNLSAHKKVAHEGVLKFVCSTCGEGFPNGIARAIHERLHSGDKPFPCEYCSKSFRAKNTLVRHLEMHLNIRKHMCHLCPKKFRKRSHLNYHLSTHKGHT